MEEEVIIQNVLKALGVILSEKYGGEWKVKGEKKNDKDGDSP